MVDKELDAKVCETLDTSRLCELFRLIAGNMLSECADVGLQSLAGIQDDLIGYEDDLTEKIWFDAISIMTNNGSGSIEFCYEGSSVVAKMSGLRGTKIPCAELNNSIRDKLLGGIEVESKVEKADIDFPEEGTEGEDIDTVEKDVEEKPEESKESESEKEEKSSKSDINELKKKIRDFYADQYQGIIGILLYCYDALFSSGYELDRPAGVLCNEGIVKVSGNNKVVHEDSATTRTMYELIQEKVPFRECSDRSIALIAQNLFMEYKGSKQLLYFPYKMLEFAFGLEAPTSSNQNSVHTYKSHADCNSWKKFMSGELTKSLKMLIGEITSAYVLGEMDSKGLSQEDYRDSGIRKDLANYLVYVKDCLSMCFVFPRYKVGVIKGERKVSDFKLRISDPTPTGYFLKLENNVTQEILQTVYLGNMGTNPFSYQPLLFKDCCVVEFAHEFDHNMAQATPLFAYKALESLKNNGIELSWDNTVLGMNEDGTILKSVPAGDTSGKGIKLSDRFTHHIIAGSRAGKGVMTLNILAGGIASRKNIFYLDRKPDMASLFKHMNPNMFVLNGGGSPSIQYDIYKQWGPDKTNPYVANVPDEVLQAFNARATWEDLGDIIYMRALKLVLGIIILRGSIGQDPRIEKLGGKDGILLIVDEFTNFQTSFNSKLEILLSKLPPTEIKKARDTLADEKSSYDQSEFDAVFNNSGYYALSYINSLIVDTEYIDTVKNADFSPMEISYSDVFTIGQDLQRTEMKPDILSVNGRDIRYSDIKTKGKTKTSKFTFGNASHALKFVNFKESDAFFGRNTENHKSAYLAQTNKNSKAYGKLDDKASNFAYLKMYDEVKRAKIASCKESENLEVASSCKYFKPFLILNTSNLQDECVQGMFERVQKNAGVSPEELTADNPSYSNPNRINEAIGFEDYINMAGVSDVSAILGKSANVANYVVQTILKYPGNWFQFVTDLSPEWMFTIEDIIKAGKDGDCPLWHPDQNPIHAEYYAFNPERFNGNYSDSTKTSADYFSKYFGDGDSSDVDSSKEDFSDTKQMEQEENKRFEQVFNDEKFDYYDEDEEIDLFEEEEMSAQEKVIQQILNFNKSANDIPLYNTTNVNELETSGAHNVLEGEVEGYSSANTYNDFKSDVHENVQTTEFSETESDVEKVKDLLRQLQELGFNFNNSVFSRDMSDANAQNPNFGGCNTYDTYADCADFEIAQPTEFGDQFVNIDYTDEVNSLAKLISVVSEDILKKFGGLERITSFRVVDGSIVVNNYYYTSKISGMYVKNIPYDIRREINSGNISSLFDYSLLRKMPNLKTLGFSSGYFLASHVTPQLGINSPKGLDFYFDTMRSLQFLIIGNDLFTRGYYREQFKVKQDDYFYLASRSSMYADMAQETIRKFRSKSWAFTKNTWTNKNCNKAVKLVGSALGLAGTTVGLAGSAGAFASRKAVRAGKSFVRGVKNLFNS